VCSEEEWDARRHRRNLLPRRRDARGRYKNPEDDANPFSVRRRYVESDTQAWNELRRISFFVGPAFLLSALFFGVGNVAKARRGYFEGSWSVARMDALVILPYCVRRLAFSPEPPQGILMGMICTRSAFGRSLQLSAALQAVVAVASAPHEAWRGLGVDDSCRAREPTCCTTQTCTELPTSASRAHL
jgi:hypothetical protein